MRTLLPPVPPMDTYGHPNAPCLSPCTLVPPLFPHIHGYPKAPHLPIPMGTLILPTSRHGHPRTPSLSLCWSPPQTPQCLPVPGVTPKPSCPPQALPRALINIRTAVQTVLAGMEVELECLGLGEPQPHVTWSKVGGRIRPGVLVRAGTLTIERVSGRMRGSTAALPPILWALFSPTSSSTCRVSADGNSKWGGCPQPRLEG